MGLDNDGLPAEGFVDVEPSTAKVPSDIFDQKTRRLPVIEMTDGEKPASVKPKGPEEEKLVLDLSDLEQVSEKAAETLPARTEEIIAVLEEQCATADTNTGCDNKAEIQIQTDRRQTIKELKNAVQGPSGTVTIPPPTLHSPETKPAGEPKSKE